MGNFELNATNYPPWAVAVAAMMNGSALRAALQAALLELLAQIKPYPAYTYVSRRSVYGTPFASDKQRRWFFAALRDGTIPRQRTGALGQSWTSRVDSPTYGVVGTNIPYARWVKDGAMQSRLLAAGGWTTVEADAARAGPAILSVMDTTIQGILTSASGNYSAR